MYMQIKFSSSGIDAPVASPRQKELRTDKPHCTFKTANSKGTIQTACMMPKLVCVFVACMCAFGGFYGTRNAQSRMN